MLRNTQISRNGNINVFEFFGFLHAVKITIMSLLIVICCVLDRATSW